MWRQKNSSNLPIVLLTDTLFFVLAWYGAFWLRFNFQIPASSHGLISRSIAFVVPVNILAFYFLDLYRGTWRYTSIKDLSNIIKAATLSSVTIFLAVYLSHGFLNFDRPALIIDWFLVIFLTAGYRVGMRLYFGFLKGDAMARHPIKSLFQKNEDAKIGIRKLIIVGAGDCGEKIYREIRDNAGLKYRVVGFLDNDFTKHGRQIHGVPILGSPDNIGLIANEMKANEILIAIPSATSKQMREIVLKCKESGIDHKTVPGMGELIDGRVAVQAIREVRYQDLIGREVVQLEEERIGEYLENAKVLVTGAGGSIGSELCRQICRFKPEALVLFERAESPLYDIEIELKRTFPYIKIVTILGDIRDRRQLSKAFEANQPQVIFHAAAYKHVPLIESHPWKGIRNNIVGTRNLVETANSFNVNRFVFVSTDKAVRPTNVMGTTKRVAELVVQGQNSCQISNTKFMIVRFGNVVGSIGSVIPLFKKQIASGGPLTVTHPEMTRYFMTIPEAAQLILQAGSMGNGSEIFILDMGTPIKIVDMARDLIQFSGLEPDRDVAIEFIGLRPGEKLYEELITEGEGIVPTSHEKIMVLKGQACEQDILNKKIDELRELAYEQDGEGIRKLLKEVVPEYQPANN